MCAGLYAKVLANNYRTVILIDAALALESVGAGCDGADEGIRIAGFVW